MGNGERPHDGEQERHAQDRPQERHGDVHALKDVAKHAVQQFCELSGLQVEALSGARPEGQGWSLLVEVVELERIPSTMSVVATYRVDTDGNGDLVSYERLRRFTRCTID